MRTPGGLESFFLTIPRQAEPSPDGNFVIGIVFTAGSKKTTPTQGAERAWRLFQNLAADHSAQCNRLL